MAGGSEEGVTRDKGPEGRREGECKGREKTYMYWN